MTRAQGTAMKLCQYLSSLLLVFICLPLMASQNTGSAKTLNGKTYSLLFFISDKTSAWSRVEKQQMLQQIIDAETWLTEQALHYNQALKFEHGFFGWDTDIKMETMPEGTASGKEDVELVEAITTQIGYNSPKELLEKIPADNIQLLFIFKKDGISYAIPYSDEVDEKYYLESMALYHRFDAETPQCTACIAHEFLHLFGAWDLYTTHQTTKKQEEKAREQYPNSIMLRTSYAIEELMIDPVTAWRIGWTKEPPLGGDFFRPQPRTP